MNTRYFLKGSVEHLLLKRKLRREMTFPERLLWSKLRSKHLGVIFRRQHVIGDYIVDFYCNHAKLVIEIDGDSHYYRKSRAHDQVRTIFLKQLGLRLIRFTNTEVTKHIDEVLTKVITYL